MNALLTRPTGVNAPRPALWAALTLAFAFLVLPDCCLNGHHAYGFGMDELGAICRAAR